MSQEKIIFAVLLVVVCFSYCTALKCIGEHLNRTFDPGMCILACGENEKCLCAGDDTPSNITGCSQRCDRQILPNKTIDKCPDMECSNLKHCFQFCRGGVECPKMRCGASKGGCAQICIGSKCPSLVCASSSCVQSCPNCTMECTSEVDECVQTCIEGECNSVCHAKKCSRSCKPAPGVSCKFSGTVSASVKVAALSLVYLILVSVFLVAPAI